MHALARGGVKFLTVSSHSTLAATAAEDKAGRQSPPISLISTCRASPANALTVAKDTAGLQSPPISLISTCRASRRRASPRSYAG